jgi:hypothetical protein
MRIHRGKKSIRIIIHITTQTKTKTKTEIDTTTDAVRLRRMDECDPRLIERRSENIQTDSEDISLPRTGKCDIEVTVTNLLDAMIRKSRAISVAPCIPKTPRPKSQ